MTYLLDTHILLWALSDPSSLSKSVREELQDPKHVVFVSSASVWEIAIKKAIGKLAVPPSLDNVLNQTQFSPLPISWPHALEAGKLPAHHKDPFDRMLIAQAKIEGLTLLTHDRRLKPYGSFVKIV